MTRGRHPRKIDPRLKAVMCRCEQCTTGRVAPPDLAKIRRLLLRTDRGRELLAAGALQGED